MLSERRTRQIRNHNLSTMEVAINNAMSLRALYCVILFTIGSGRYIRCIDGFVVTTTTTTADFIIKNRQQQSVRRTGRCSHILSSSSKTSPLHETPTSAISREGKEASSSPLDSSSLKRLGACKSSTQAKRLLEKALIGNDGGRRGDDDEEQTVGALYGSVSIPSGASSRGISDGDLAIQTRMVNKKYKIMDLIELSGDRDIDRASASLFGLFIASTSSAIVVNENFPGPEILRFVVVLLLSFLPLAFVGYGLSDADKLQALLVKIQREVFPVYRKRMIQHEAGRKLQNVTNRTDACSSLLEKPNLTIHSCVIHLFQIFLSDVSFSSFLRFAIVQSSTSFERCTYSFLTQIDFAHDAVPRFCSFVGFTCAIK